MGQEDFGSMYIVPPSMPHFILQVVAVTRGNGRGWMSREPIPGKGCTAEPGVEDTFFPVEGPGLHKRTRGHGSRKEQPQGKRRR